jgi:glycine cleavage system transcriptional repressor
MSESQKQFVISITSRDRVGIVYEISQAISELNGNIADIRQSVLCGYFTMILLVSFPADITQRAIERKLSEVDAHSETTIDATVRKVEGTYVPFTPIPENVYVLTATGPDRIGFVATVASFCVQHKINILDLSTTVSDGDYVMILIIDLKKISVSINAVRQDLQQFASETGLKIVLQHYDIFRAVNEISLPIR